MPSLLLLILLGSTLGDAVSDGDSLDEDDDDDEDYTSISDEAYDSKNTLG